MAKKKRNGFYQDNCTDLSPVLLHKKAAQGVRPIIIYCLGVNLELPGDAGTHPQPPLVVDANSTVMLKL